MNVHIDEPLTPPGSSTWHFDETGISITKFKQRPVDIYVAAGKAFRPAGAQAWAYAKVEMVPPMTQDFFQGAGGKALEKSVGGVVDSVIASIEASIKAMDDAAEAKRKAAEDKIKAAEQAAADKEKARALAESKKKEAKKEATEAAAKKKQDEEKATAEKAAAEAAEKAKKAKPAEKPKNK